MAAELLPVDPTGEMPVRFLENKLPELIASRDLHSAQGALKAAEVIQAAYADSPETKEMTRSAEGLVKSKEHKPYRLIHGKRERPADQTWRAQVLHSLVWHKARTRNDYDAEEMKADFRGVFQSMTPINYGYLRESLFAPKQEQVLKAKNLTPRLELALQVSEQVAEQYHVTPKKVVRALGVLAHELRPHK